jgi:hypothetical protein
MPITSDPGTRKTQAPAHMINNADTSAALSTSDFSKTRKSQAPCPQPSDTLDPSSPVPSSNNATAASDSSINTVTLQIQNPVNAIAPQVQDTADTVSNTVTTAPQEIVTNTANINATAALQAQDINTALQVSVTDSTNIDIPTTPQVQNAINTASPDTKNATATPQVQGTVNAAANAADIKTTTDIDIVQTSKPQHSRCPASTRNRQR